MNKTPEKKDEKQEEPMDPQFDIPDLSPKAIALIREANRHVEVDYVPTQSLFPGLL